MLRWEELSSAQLAEVVAADPDGPHLPVGTDTVVATAVAEAAAGDAEQAVVLPSIAFGASQFHGTELAGTVAFSGADVAA